jgi:uncharacterized membrane protein
VKAVVFTLERFRHAAALLLGGAFVFIGIQHFIGPSFFDPIVPDVLGFPRFWVYASGVVEITLGCAMIAPMTRGRAGWAMAGFLVVLYWANFNMWINDIPLNGTRFSNTAHAARGMAQIAMIGLAVMIARGEPRVKK